MITKPRLAVLIDAENVSAQNASQLFTEIAQLGDACVRRIFGDFSHPRLKPWGERVASLGLVPRQTFSHTTGKNSADIALVIDAMDLLEGGRLDGFCLVSSDSDFTGLSLRIREQGLIVFGFGEAKASKAFQSACSRFFTLSGSSLKNQTRPAVTGQMAPKSEIATASPPKMAAGPPASSGRRPKLAAALALEAREPIEDAVRLIQAVIEFTNADDGWVPLAQVGNLIAGLKPDFASRAYGNASLIKLVKKAATFEIRPDRCGYSIRAKPRPSLEAAQLVAEG